MKISPSDRSILRALADQYAEFATLPVHRTTIQEWKRLNRLQHGRPLIWINEIPWHEMDVAGELTLQCSDPFCRLQEQQLRQMIYQWRHMPCDMVLDPVFYCLKVICDTGFGIVEDIEVQRTDAANSVISRQFHGQIRSEADIARIKTPEVSCDTEATGENYETLAALFGDILPIEKRGQPGFWFAPWDQLVRWWGVEEAMLALIEQPELVHYAMDHLVSAHLARLDQYEQLGLLAPNNTNVRVGSGGLGYCDELPQPGCSPGRVRAADLWGCATAQIFSSVSPRMHEEFALQHERRWLARFGLKYYGCCEPLDSKVAILAKGVPNLRKISMSPWINVERAIRAVGDRYVFSYKPNPAIFAEESWQPERARRDLVVFLEAARGCVVEIIMKDISTVRYEPQRLWEWARIASELADAFLM
jgi:hypothetical protein